MRDGPIRQLDALERQGKDSTGKPRHPGEIVLPLGVPGRIDRGRRERHATSDGRVEQNQIASAPADPAPPEAPAAPVVDQPGADDDAEQVAHDVVHRAVPPRDERDLGELDPDAAQSSDQRRRSRCSSPATRARAQRDEQDHVLQDVGGFERRRLEPGDLGWGSRVSSAIATTAAAVTILPAMIRCGTSPAAITRRAVASARRRPRPAG